MSVDTRAHRACVLAAAWIVGCAAVSPRGASRHDGSDAYTGAQLAAVVTVRELALAPDGRTLAYVSDRTGALELYTLDLTRADAAPVQRTHAGEHVTDLAWSPDARTLTFAMDHGGDERTDLFVLDADAPSPRQLTATPTAERGARVSPDGTRRVFESDPDRPFRFELMLRDADGRVTRLTHEPVNVTHARWTRDGRSVVATRSGDDQRGDLLVIDASTGATRAIAPPRADGIAIAIDSLPDARMLVLATNARGFAQLATVDLATGASAFVGPGDWDVDDAEVAADDGTVVFTRNVHGESEVNLAPRGDFARVRVLTRGGVVTSVGIDRTSRTIAVLREASDHPAEIVTLDPADGRATVRVPSDVAGVRLDPLARAERRTLASFDGTPVDVFVWSPRVRRLGTPPPLVVHVHGGPNAQTRGAFSPTVQALAEAGFVVASVNYRGSTGYGRAFEDMNNHDWGGGDLRDLVHVVRALARTGEIDARRVGIFGGSYGGYLTLRALTAAPDVWAAGVDMYGMPDLAEDFRLTSDRFGTWYLTEMGDPATTEAALYRDRSPIHALDRIRAPLLVLQGANDHNVPVSESDGLVAALRARGRTVDYVVYPGEGHGFTHREHRVDAIERTVRFFVRAL